MSQIIRPVNEPPNGISGQCNSVESGDWADLAIGSEQSISQLMLPLPGFSLLQAPQHLLHPEG
jgi:hypothetical protein